MAYRVTITEDAKRQLLVLSARERRIAEDGVAARLIHEPMVETRAVKRLRPNPLADYELRLGDLRLLYKVDEAGSEVVIGLIGRRSGNLLIVEGEEFHGHESHSSE